MNIEFALVYKSKMIMGDDRYNSGVKRDKVAEIKDKMSEWIKKHGAYKTGDFIVFVLNAKVAVGELDLEIIAPINKKIPPSGGDRFDCRENFKVQRCIMSKYQGYFLTPRVVYERMRQETR
ncbi:MAG: hypothetical protein FWE33_03965 [Defluviitaleaceae bacterium]|nr:hypothetical protein [Defluviitaleaceae bacterium]